LRMSPTQLGVACCLGYVLLQAIQAVFLGSVFQGADSFLVGAWVFGISVVVCIGATAVFRPAELIAAARAWQLVVILNLISAIVWVTFFFAIELVEPAVVFTIFSGMVPLGTVLARWFGIPEASLPGDWRFRLGNILILLSILILTGITVSGLSGFVRGGADAAAAGVFLAAVSGTGTAFIILYSVRLNARRVGPFAQFGLRFILYTVLAIIGVRMGIDAKEGAEPGLPLAVVVAAGLVVIALPLYLVQKAVPLIPASTIAALAALGPVVVFTAQFADGRVHTSSATFEGLLVFIAGALIAVWGQRGITPTVPPAKG